MPEITVYPALVIGLGEGGEKVCRTALSQLAESYPGATHTAGFVVAGPDGWHALSPDQMGVDPPAQEEHPHSDWDRRRWSKHFGSDAQYSVGYQVLLRLIESEVLAERALRSACDAGYSLPSPTPLLEIYIAFSLGDSLGSGAFYPVLSMVRELESYLKQKIAVLALVDLSSIRSQQDREAGIRQIGAGLAELNGIMTGRVVLTGTKIEVLSEPRSPHRGRPHACILADQRNADGLYVDSPDDVLAALGQYLASWLACDIRNAQEDLYRPQMGLGISFVPPGIEAGMCRIVGSHSFVVPVRAVTRYCALRLAEDVLNHQFLQEDELDEQAFSTAEAEFVTDMQFEKGHILAALRDVSPLPALSSYLNPAEVEQIPREELVDSLRSLDSFLGSTRIPSYLDRITENSQQIQETYKEGLDQKVDALVNSGPAGFRIARGFLEHFKFALEEMLAEPGKTPRVTELGPYAGDLRAAISRCPNRRALLIKCGLLLILLAYTVFGTDLLSRHYDQNILISLLVLVAMALVLGLVAFSVIWIREGWVQQALRAFLNEGLRSKHDDVLRFAAQQEYERLISSQISCVDTWLDEESPLNRLQPELQKAMNEAQERVPTSYYQIAGSSEESLLDREDYARLYRENTVDTGAAAEDWMRQGHMESWRTLVAEVVLETLVDLYYREFEPRFKRLEVETELQRKHTPTQSVTDIYYERLRQEAVPLLHYASGAFTHSETVQELLLVKDAETSAFANAVAGDARVIVSSTGCAHRITCLRIIQDVAFVEVDAWRKGVERLQRADASTLELLHLVTNWKTLYEM